MENIATLLGIWPTTAHQFLTLFSASICVQPAVIKSPFHATGSTRTAVGLFLLLVRRSGTHCPKSYGICSVLWTATDSHWRHFYFHSTSVFSALEVCYENVLYTVNWLLTLILTLTWTLYWFASASFSGPLLSHSVEFCGFVCVFVGLFVRNFEVKYLGNQRS